MNTSFSEIQNNETVDVIICGGGPVGLSAAYLLGRAGIRVTLFEKRPSTTTLPKGQYLHASTGEIFQQWGVWDLLQNAGWETMRSNGQGFYVNVANGPIAGIWAAESNHEDYVKKWEAYSPAFPRKVPASDYESAIRKKASAWPTAQLIFNAQAVDVNSQADAIRLTVQSTESGQEKTIHAKYLLACDGAHSFIRSRLGSGQDHGPLFDNQILVEFKADLDDTLGKDGFFHSFVVNPKYAGWLGSKHPETGLWRYSFRHDEDTPPNEEMVLERLLGALGMPSLEVENVQYYRFDYSTGLLRNWREGNVFFLGDAAHWHSPWGGFGMNSGIQDANNLAWKLACVLQGRASDALLDTYMDERHSKALVTVKSATYNSLHYQAIAQALRVGEGDNMAKGIISDEAKRFLKKYVAPHGDNSVLHTGYQLGTVYTSKAIIASEKQAPEPELVNYIETTIPGVRAPHVWLRNNKNERISCIALWSPEFAIIGASAYLQNTEAIAKQLQQDTGVKVKVIAVGPNGNYIADDDKFERLYNASEGNIFIIRPDGFIGASIKLNNNTNLPTVLAAQLTCILHAKGTTCQESAQTHEAIA